MHDAIGRPARSFRALVGLDGPTIAWGRVGFFLLALVVMRVPERLYFAGQPPVEPDVRPWISAVLFELDLVAAAVVAFRLIRRDILAAVAAALAAAFLDEALLLLVYGRDVWANDSPAARLVFVGMNAACTLVHLWLLVALLPRLRSAWWAVALATLAAEVARRVGFTLWFALAVEVHGVWARLAELLLDLASSAVLAGALWGAATGERLAPLLLSWRGRIGRARYWAAWAVLTPLGMGLASVMWGLPWASRHGGPDGPAFIALPFWVLVAWCQLALAAKRLHDRDLSGWHLLTALVPVAGSLYLLVVVGMLPGTPGANRFGPDPLVPPLNQPAS